MAANDAECRPDSPDKPLSQCHRSLTDNDLVALHDGMLQLSPSLLQILQHQLSLPSLAVSHSSVHNLAL